MNLPGVYKSILDKWENYQDVFVVSDTHFNDSELRAGIPNRASDDEIVKNINSKCGRKSVLICLGDVGDEAKVRQLKAGYKILIAGNHDRGSTNYLRQIERYSFEQKYFTYTQAEAEVRALHPGWKIEVCDYENYWWIVTADNQMFDEVYEGALTLGEKIILSHEPLPNCPWWYNLHGHVHRNTLASANHLNCCLDGNGYQPINLNTLLKSGVTSHIEPLHRTTINRATVRAKKRGSRRKGSKE